MGYLRSLVGPADAEDLTQDVLILIYRKLTWLEDPQLFRPWIFRIASREAFRHLKKTRRWQDKFAEAEALEQVPAEEVSPPNELLDQLATMDGISPASRAVLMLHFREEMSLPEVAGVLGIPLGTAKSRLAYGLSALRKHLSRDTRP
jgi:RNA polymerase sigma-70 factor (ECF subfamily)